MSSTTPNTAPYNKLVTAAGVFVLSLSAATAFVGGTGSSGNHSDLVQGIANYSDYYPEIRASLRVGVAEDLEFIKSALKLTTSELAKYLGVSRQAIYDWKSGAHIKSHNISKLENMRKAAEVVLAAAPAPSSIMLSRKLAGGRTLLETIAAGSDGDAAARSLISMLEREANNRKKMSEKIAGLKPLRPSKFAGAAAITRG